MNDTKIIENTGVEAVTDYLEAEPQKDTLNYRGQRVEVESEGFKLKGNLVRVANYESRPGILIAHGASKDGNPMDYLAELQRFLAENGYSSLVIHNRGVGQGEDRSGGFYESTLINRETDLINGLKYLGQFVNPKALGIIAGSMNGETGCLVAADLQDQLKALVLLEPAAYPAGAERVPLGPEFTMAIRREDLSPAEKDNLLRNSPAFSALEKFSGPAMVAYGDEDKIIDRSVQEQYQNRIAKRGPNGQAILIEQTKHSLLTEPNERLYQEVVEFLNFHFDQN